MRKLRTTNLFKFFTLGGHHQQPRNVGSWYADFIEVGRTSITDTVKDEQRNPEDDPLLDL